jgi:hypothetical protein
MQPIKPPHKCSEIQSMCGEDAFKVHRALVMEIIKHGQPELFELSLGLEKTIECVEELMDEGLIRVYVSKNKTITVGIYDPTIEEYRNF